MKHIIPDYTFPEDPHVVVRDADFAPLDALYDGRVARFGDFHAHSKSGGTSDGKTTPAEWLEAAKELKIDFLGLMDHRQVRHQYLPEFDPTFFLYGTEPSGLWLEPQLKCHYLMIFPEREGLEHVLEKFPDTFEFTGGVEGTFSYNYMTRERFLEIREAVLAEGGAFVNAHPKQVIMSDNIEDFYFGEGMTMEVIYVNAHADALNPHTQENYTLWLRMLDADMKVYNTATADVHGIPKNRGLSFVYASESHCREYVKRLRVGDVGGGYVAIKMSIDGHPTGSSVEYREGMKLLIKIEDAHELRFAPEVRYRVDVHSDRGLVYSAPLTMPFSVAIEAQPRRLYRVEVLREEDGSPAAIGNPIWLSF